jgi:predicted nucleic acid-binding protein
VWIASYQGDDTREDVQTLRLAMRFGLTALAPPVLAELLSDPGLPASDRELIAGVPLLRFNPGFWVRTGLMRAMLFKRGYKPKLTDTVIAQLCIDYEIPLLTRDRDFTPFAKHAGLALSK